MKVMRTLMMAALGYGAYAAYKRWRGSRIDLNA
jgi:hypothetical protein